MQTSVRLKKQTGGIVMSVYKYETHLHTSQGSACGCCSGAEQVENLKRLGYDGCFVTDHFFTGNTAIDRSLPWREKVELFCQGYEEAKSAATSLGFRSFSAGNTPMPRRSF